MERAARVIAHVDMDAFFAAVEMRDHPEYRGLPVVVGAGPHARGVIAAASYEARRYGIHSAMPSRRAFALCPTAVFLAPEMDRYQAESRRLFELLGTFTPYVEPVSVDEAFLDLTGCPIPVDPGVREPAGAQDQDGTVAELGLVFGRVIQRRIHHDLGLPASVGVAPNKFLAKVASELAKPDGVRRITPQTVQSVLDPLPVQALWGVGKDSRARLEAAGIATVGALRRTAPSTLRAILGFAAERLIALARGEDDRAVEPGADAKSIGRENTFDHDTRDKALLARTLRTLCEDVARRLRAEGFAGRVVTLKVRFEPFDTVTRRTTLPASTDHGGRIADTAAGLWQRLAAKEPRRVRLIGVSVSGLERPAASQMGLFGGSSSKRVPWGRALAPWGGRSAGGPSAARASAQDEATRLTSVDRVVDAINERFGAGTVNSAGVIEPSAATRPRRRRPAATRRAPRS